MPRVRIKICGLTNAADALRATALGADALGFIFVAGSPRAVTPAAARAIIEQLPPLVTLVAVVRNESVETVREIMALSGCQVAQLHGEEPPEFLEALRWPAIKAIAVANAGDVEAIARYRTTARAVLLDTKVGGQSGGTGQTFDWQLARHAQRYGLPLVLSGGLHPGNIAAAIRTVRPYAVDISSGIEAAPGQKDPALMQALFEAIRQGEGEEEEIID